MERTMFYGATPYIFSRARKLRQDLTQSEIVLWNYLRASPLGFKFRRQHPVGNYIADFFCFKLKLVIEVDGGVHDNGDVQLHDAERDKFLLAQGLTVIRLTNTEINTGLEFVMEKILNLMRNLTPKSGLTPPLGGRGVK